MKSVSFDMRMMELSDGCTGEQQEMSDSSIMIDCMGPGFVITCY